MIIRRFIGVKIAEHYMSSVISSLVGQTLSILSNFYRLCRWGWGIVFQLLFSLCSPYDL